jgi:hypothetical protein
MSPPTTGRVIFYSREALRKHTGGEAADVESSIIPWKIAAWAVAYTSEAGKKRRQKERAPLEHEATHGQKVRLQIPCLWP